MRYTSIIILVLLLLTGCQFEPVEPNIETTVSGRVYDNWNQQPIPNFKIRVAEYMKRRAGEGVTRHFIQFIDSTHTDANGYYSFVFQTTGKGNYYRLEYDLPYNYHYYHGDYNEIKAGEANEINYDFQRTVTLKARIMVHDNPVQILRVGSKVDGRYLDKIHGTDNDTVRYMQVSRNSRNKIDFSIPVGNYSKFHSEYVEVGDVAFNDTLQHTFEVFPSDFK